MIDIGVNLADKAFAGDLDAVLERAAAAGVHRMVVTGTSVGGSRAARELASDYPRALWSTAGVHPHDARSFTSETAAELRALASDDRVVAIGECGLDYNRDFSPRPDQRRAFAAQVDLAIELSMPLFVHERDAASDLLAILDERRGELGPLVVHCFTGDGPTLRGYLERDFYIGITGWICDERRGTHLLDLISEIPGDRLMVETDSPYLLPRTIRPRPKKRRNEPAYLVAVVDAIADAIGQSRTEVAARTTAVAEQFFGLTARTADPPDRTSAR